MKRAWNILRLNWYSPAQHNGSDQNKYQQSYRDQISFWLNYV